MIYRALIRSKMDYGGALFESASPSEKKKLDIIQSKALKICLGLPKSTANASTLRESGELPLDLRRNLSTIQNIHRLSSLPSSNPRPYTPHSTLIPIGYPKGLVFGDIGYPADAGLIPPFEYGVSYGYTSVSLLTARRMPFRIPDGYRSP